MIEKPDLSLSRAAGEDPELDDETKSQPNSTNTPTQTVVQLTSLNRPVDTVLAGNAKLVQEVEALNQALLRLKRENDDLTAQLQMCKYEVEFMTNKLKQVEKTSVASSESGKDSLIAKLRNDLNDIRKWKTKFLKREKSRLQKTRKIIEKRKLRRDWILKEIASGRKTQKDMYLIYSKSRLPIDAQIDAMVERGQSVFPQDFHPTEEAATFHHFVSQAEAAATISHTVNRVGPSGQPMTRSPTKKAANPSKPKYASPPANPTQVFTYKLKPTQKVHLPADHPQTPTIQNKDKVEIVFNDADAAIANSQPSAQLVSQVPHNIYVAPHPQQQVSTVTVGESRSDH